MMRRNTGVGPDTIKIKTGSWKRTKERLQATTALQHRPAKATEGMLPAHEPEFQTAIPPAVP
ncbi:hypothetical protein [Afifella sp. YEN Y35]|uniref:hypothetical protein n=1 Tax=Afifella sp. YEN Y35 TaxID=3388337 RepID=UPI0039E1C428